MELKSVRSVAFAWALPGFNCTFMELKLVKITQYVSIISWLSVFYTLNGRKVTVWILFRYEKVIFNVFNF